MFDISSLANDSFTFVFDENNSLWVSTPEYNRMFLRAQQQYANDLLHASTKPLFLNDVLGMLGIPRTAAGQVVGWAAISTVDFGVQEEAGRIVLKFNIDGPVIHLLA